MWLHIFSFMRKEGIFQMFQCLPCRVLTFSFLNRLKPFALFLLGLLQIIVKGVKFLCVSDKMVQ